MISTKSDLKYEKITVVFSVILLLLVCGTGFWVYSKLSSVSDDIAEGRMKDSRLLILKELNNDLITAENFAFSYTITRKDSLLTQFYLIQHASEFKLKQLRKLPSGDRNYKKTIDTLESVVKQRFTTMEDLVLVQNENRVNDAMDQVIYEVKSMTRPKMDVPVKAPENEDKKERRRLFQRRLDERKAKEALKKKESNLNSATINAGLIEIKKDVVQEEQLKNGRKLIVEQKNNRLIAQFTQIIQTIENQEKKAALEEASHAKKIAQETNVIIALFCLTSVLLILFTSYLLFIFLSKTKATTTQLMIAKQKSDQLTQSKSQFLANMSHELRTPLNAIVGFTEQLKSTELHNDQSYKVEIISKAADHLTRITNEILDFSKLSAGQVKVENIPFSIAEEVEFVVTTLTQLATDGSNKIAVKIDHEVPKMLLGDPMRIRQILINLIGNSLKFTEGGTVTVSIRPDLQSQEETTLRISVADTGIGISEENLARIFDEFEQAETSVARKFGGTGLGLSITRMLVDRMSGSITVKSKVGKGTTFTVSLPFRIAENQSMITAKADKKAADLAFLKNKSVLVVDDEAYNRKLLRNILEKAGAKTTEAGNGEEALEAMEHSRYDLVLLDLRMPKMDGFQTLKAIRKLDDPHKSVPVIALTAAISQEDRLAMVRDTWKGVLLKPFKINELAAIVGKAMNGGKEPKPEEQPAEEVPAFTLAPLKELSGSDLAFYLDMLTTLARTTEDGMKAIKERSDMKDWLGMAEAAHKIAAPVKHMHATDIYEDLKLLESAGRSGDVSIIPSDTITLLGQKIDAVLQQIHAEITTVQSSIDANTH